MNIGRSGIGAGMAMVPAAAGKPVKSQVMTTRPQNIHAAYHAHIYFGPGTAEQARALREAASRELKVSVGRFHEKLVGPHPHWSCQLAFTREEFENVVPWLESHRNGLTFSCMGSPAMTWKTIRRMRTGWAIPRRSTCRCSARNPDKAGCPTCDPGQFSQNPENSGNSCTMRACR